MFTYNTFKLLKTLPVCLQAKIYFQLMLIIFAALYSIQVSVYSFYRIEICVITSEIQSGSEMTA